MVADVNTIGAPAVFATARTELGAGDGWGGVDAPGKSCLDVVEVTLKAAKGDGP